MNGKILQGHAERMFWPKSGCVTGIIIALITNYIGFDYCSWQPLPCYRNRRIRTSTGWGDYRYEAKNFLALSFATEALRLPLSWQAFKSGGSLTDRILSQLKESTLRWSSLVNWLSRELLKMAKLKSWYTSQITQSWQSLRSQQFFGSQNCCPVYSQEMQSCEYWLYGDLAANGNSAWRMSLYRGKYFH